MFHALDDQIKQAAAAFIDTPKTRDQLLADHINEQFLNDKVSNPAKATALAQQLAKDKNYLALEYAAVRANNTAKDLESQSHDMAGYSHTSQPFGGLANERSALLEGAQASRQLANQVSEARNKYIADAAVVAGVSQADAGAVKDALDATTPTEAEYWEARKAAKAKEAEKTRPEVRSL